MFNCRSFVSSEEELFAFSNRAVIPIPHCQTNVRNNRPIFRQEGSGCGKTEQRSGWGTGKECQLTKRSHLLSSAKLWFFIWSQPHLEIDLFTLESIRQAAAKRKLNLWWHCRWHTEEAAEKGQQQMHNPMGWMSNCKWPQWACQSTEQMMKLKDSCCYHNLKRNYSNNHLLDKLSWIKTEAAC